MVADEMIIFVNVVRVLVGLAGGAVGIALASASGVERPLAVTTIVIGFFILAHAVLDLIFMSLPPETRAEATGDQGDVAKLVKAEVSRQMGSFLRSAPGPDSPRAFAGFVESAGFYVTTPAVVLGLLTVFGSSSSPTVTLKVGALALAVTLLVGLVLHSYVSTLTDDSNKFVKGLIVPILFNLALWALSLGLLAITMSVVYR